MLRSLAAVFASLTVVASAGAAPPPPEKTLRLAADVLDELAAIPAKSIPTDLMAEAQGVAIIPHVIKAGFIVGGRGGHGIVMDKKAGVWSDPVFVDFGGASVGFQAGVESTDVVLVFRTRKSLDRLLEGKGKVTLGADASVAAGPVGRTAAAATDGKLEAEIVSYSRSRGLFAGVALSGAVVKPDETANAAFIRDAKGEDKKLADAVKVRLLEMASTKPVSR